MHKPNASVIEDGAARPPDPGVPSTGDAPSLPVFSVDFQPGVDINDNSALLDVLDEGVTIDEMR